MLRNFTKLASIAKPTNIQANIRQMSTCPFSSLAASPAPATSAPPASAAAAPAGLSQETIDIVKSTAPVLAEHGYAITSAMYGRMLTAHPDVKAMFNPAHQVEMHGQLANQPHALACSIHAYAANVDNLGALAEVVERVAQKHVSLHVLAEHYPVVGENVLWAIKDVLGDAATPAVINAWGEAFGFLAKIFIDRETQIREAKAAAEGGWEGWRDFVVQRTVDESDEIKSFYLAPKDGKSMITYKPGQYTSLRLENDEFTTQRNYTLSSAPDSSTWRITVKREGPWTEGAPSGQVSNWLHDNVVEGTVLKLGVPCGDFVLETNHDKPYVLLAGGVGLTPVVAMLEHLVEMGVKNNIYMIMAARSPETEAMHDVLAKYRRKHLNLFIKTIYDKGEGDYPTGPLSMDQLDSMLVTRDNQYYFCGPPAFMKTVHKGLTEWKIPTEQIHYEFFGPHLD